MKAKRVIGIVLAVMVAILSDVGPALASPLCQSYDFEEIPGAPLRIQVGADARVQVYHEKYTYGAAYGSGDSGPFFAIGEDVYGPLMEAGNYVNPLDPVSHEGPSGSGADGDPFRIVTTQRLNGSGADLSVVQTVFYINGNNYLQLDWQITNDGGGQTCFKFYHAADLYFADDDYGIGYYNAATGSIGGFNQERNWFMVFTPLTPAAHYKEAYYSTIWDNIVAAADLNDTIDAEYIDNGAALQWDVCLQAGGTTTISDLWSFGESEAEVIPPEVAPQPGPVDVWAKDSPEDDGSVPSSRLNAAWWTSPDIIVRNQRDESREHQNPVRGQENSVYVRVRNRGTEDAQNVRVNVYYADANLLAPFWPDSWNPIGSTVVNVPAGEVVWTDAIAWSPPETGHMCLLVRLESDQDPIRVEGDVPGDNNIAQRNVHVLDLPQQVSGDTGSGSVDMVAVGPPGAGEHYVEIIVQYPDRPPSLKIYIVLPPGLFARWQDAGGTLTGGQIEGERILATGANETVIGGLPLGPGEEARITLEIEGPTEEPFAIGGVERVDGEDVGGNVYIYQGLVPTPTPEEGQPWELPSGCCPCPAAAVVLVMGLLLFLRQAKG